MVEESANPEWYYVGHYGQLGPLTLEQMTDLITDGVIDSQTFVWRNGQPDWAQAASISALSALFNHSQPPNGPYSSGSTPPAFNPETYSAPNPHQYSTEEQKHSHLKHANFQHPVSPINIHNYSIVPKSDKSRIAAGVLNILPGFGRFYLGYAAHGVLQLLTSFCFVGLIWSWLDGLYIMTGGVKYDGYGRVIED